MLNNINRLKDQLEGNLMKIRKDDLNIIKPDKNTFRINFWILKNYNQFEIFEILNMKILKY